MLFFCANCGFPLTVTRKALPSKGIIVELVNWHECSEEPQELNIPDNPLPAFVPEDKKKFVQKLDGLPKRALPPSTAPSPYGVSTANLRDRRPTEQVKSSAPETIISRIKEMRGVELEPPQSLTPNEVSDD